MRLTMANQAVTQASSYFDLQGLDQLRQQAQGNGKEAVREVANQFESMFASMLIKSMRQANEAFETDSPFNNRQTKFYTDMQDKQLALDISRHGSLGLADALVRQLDPSSIIGPESVPQEQLTMPGSEKQQMIDLQKDLGPVDLNPADRMSFSPRRPAENREAAVDENIQAVINTRQPEADNGGKRPEFADKKSFIETLMPYAKKAAQALGIAPEVLVAQSALETGWGKKIINSADNQSSFNLFNIKANKSWQGDKVAKDSLEVEGGVGVKRRSNFRAYGSLQESFADYQNFISKSKRYQEALQQGEDSQAYIEELQQAGYATDPKYAEKIKKIMQNQEFKAVLAGGDFNG
ncbi:flagellar assembly peptidoglycan hydrolase FlgJ [Psychromonas ossibalaenae]|uniref:flagellar assembly peptidoglycan hydrolase FlgJ n=1 Tax=Psychromonas ossibalaenae TaxID=444922 RepID=UPI0003A4EFE1|nr:flagellar assembly peptidoglycan hydrolase FlgJ [Psychromonas ossibalaenae]